MKVAIYARSSSDNQRDASIADQFASAASSQNAKDGQSPRSSTITRFPAPHFCAPAFRR